MSMPGVARASLLSVLLSAAHRVASAANCLDGQYKSSASTCLACAPGKFMADNNAHQNTACTDCEAGTYQPQTGMTECWTCPKSSNSTAGASSCILELPCDPCIDRPQVKIRAVVHGKKTDSFWLRVQRAMRTAAKHMKVDFAIYLQTKENSEVMRDQILQVISDEKPDVLLATIPNPTVFPAVLAAAQSAHVFTLNSGADTYLQAGSKAHFSMDEYLGGYQAAAQFQKAFQASGSSLGACQALNHEDGNSALTARANGYKKACEDLGLQWLGVQLTDGDSSDDNKIKVKSMISTYSGANGLGILLLGAATAAGARSAYQEEGSPANVKIGSFDLDQNVFDGLTAGDIIFGIDQNEWLQGFLPVVISTLYVTTGNLMAPSLYPTGPKFVTEAPTTADSSRSAEAYPVCDCPWAGGKEQNLACSASTAGINPIGQCPRDAGQCTVDCVDGRSFKLRGVTHGHETDAFWFVVKAGAVQAARDLRLQDFEMDLFASPGSGSSNAFTNDLFASTITSVANDPTVDGMFVSLHGPHIYDEVTAAAGKVPLVTINSGYDVSESLNPTGGKMLGHVGMDERKAGELAGEKLAAAGAKKLLCIVHEAGNSALDARCDGAGDKMVAAGGSSTKLNLITENVDVSSDDDISDYLKNTPLQSDFDSVLCSGVTTFLPALSAIKATGKSKNAFFAGSFDSSPELVNAIATGDFFLFAVDQQQYMQGYMGVMSLYMHLVAGQKLADYVIQSGPFFISGAEPSKDKCIASPWASDPNNPIVGEAFLPSKDPSLITGFPVCEYLGDCEDYTSYFDKAEGRCVPCPAGTYKTQLMSACETCPNGTSTSMEVGSSQCRACPRGSFAIGGDPDCSFCEKGTFADAAGSSECTSCAAPFVTENIAQSSNASCVCPEGTYGDGGGYVSGGRCLPCPEAMTCALGSDKRFFPMAEGAAEGEYPKVKEGFMTRQSDPFRVYYCVDAWSCPGGPPGSCADSRDPDSISCGECLPDTYPGDEGKCYPCDDARATAILVLVLAIIIIFVCLVAVTVVASREAVKQTSSKVTLIVLTGFSFSGLQVLSVFHSLAMDWFEPMKSILAVASLISFDFTVLKLGCIFGSGSVYKYLIGQLLVPGLIPFVLVTLKCKRIWVKSLMDIRTELLNTVGIIFSTVFIPITLSSLAPLIRVEHPGDSGHSIKSMPSILWFDDDAYGVLLTFGVLGFFLVPLPFLALCAYGTRKYPTWILSQGRSKTAAEALLGFRFLFTRFTPACYFYGLVVLIRSLVICLVPVVLNGQGNIVSQVVIMAMVLCSFTLLQQRLNPWRGGSTNSLDGMLNLCMVILLLCGSMAAGIASNSSQVKYLGMFAFIIFISIGLGSLAVSVYRFYSPKDLYNMFICHHKAGAAAQARLMKLILQQKGKKVFIDSDDLQELDTLFDIVNTRVEHLVVYLTAYTLSRPWCAGEIATACGNGSIKITAVKHASFAPPSEEVLSDPELILDLTSCNLAEYGISSKRVGEAYRKLLGGDIPSLEVDRRLPGTRCFYQVINNLLNANVSKTSRKNSLDEFVDAPVRNHPTTPGMVLLVCDSQDDEAVAATEVLVSKIKPAILGAVEVGMCCLADHSSSDPATLAQFVMSSLATVVILSKDSMVSGLQLLVITALMEVLGDGSDVHKPELVSLCLPSFTFPTDTFYQKTLPKVWTENTEQAEKLIGSFFKRIALPFSTFASDSVLDTQANDVLLRIPQDGKVGKTVRTPSGIVSSGPSINSGEALPENVEEAQTPGLEI